MIPRRAEITHAARRHAAPGRLPLRRRGDARGHQQRRACGAASSARVGGERSERRLQASTTTPLRRRTTRRTTRRTGSRTSSRASSRRTSTTTVGPRPSTTCSTTPSRTRRGAGDGSSARVEREPPACATSSTSGRGARDRALESGRSECASPPGRGGPAAHRRLDPARVPLHGLLPAVSVRRVDGHAADLHVVRRPAPAPDARRGVAL